MSKDSLAALLRALLSPCKEDIWAKAHYSDPENERNSFRFVKTTTETGFIVVTTSSTRKKIRVNGPLKP